MFKFYPIFTSPFSDAATSILQLSSFSTRSTDSMLMSFYDFVMIFAIFENR